MVATEPLVPVTKLRIKFGSQGAHKSFQQPSVINERGHRKYVNGSDRSTIEKIFNADSSRKRGPQELAEWQANKRQKMDRNMSRQCSVLLRTLMDHSFGWVFHQPVDPIKLNIPDYFKVISKPMDLGTIKSKLGKNAYVCTEEFAADVRLTFSNAMLYNPPSNEFHKMAKTLKEVFEDRWKFLEKKWNPELSKALMDEDLKRDSRELDESQRNRPETPTLSDCSVVKRSKPVDEKVKKVSLDVRPVRVTAKVKFNKPDYSHPSTKLAGKNSCKGTESGGRHNCGSAGTKQPLFSATFNSNITLDKSCRDNGSDASSISDCWAKSISITQMSKSDPDSDGAVSSMDDQNPCPSSQPTVPATDAASSEGFKTPVFDVEMSPKKALRAAMLKSRFADTILKAKQRTLLDHSSNADPVKMKQEKERLEKRHCEEKARIEAEIRAAEAATRLREEHELKRQREIEREAARLELQKMEEKVVIEENLEVEKELEMLCGSDIVRQAFRGAQLLEKLGLFMKDEYLVDETEDMVLSGDGEEGEIFS